MRNATRSRTRATARRPAAVAAAATPETFWSHCAVHAVNSRTVWEPLLRACGGFEFEAGAAAAAATVRVPLRVLCG